MEITRIAVTTVCELLNFIPGNLKKSSDAVRHVGFFVGQICKLHPEIPSSNAVRTLGKIFSLKLPVNAEWIAIINDSSL